MINWQVIYDDFTTIASGKNQYEKIDRKKVWYIDFFNDDKFITAVYPEKKKFIIRRRVLNNMITGETIYSYWLIGWENGLLRKPTVTYINEQYNTVIKDNKWIPTKPILREEEK